MCLPYFTNLIGQNRDGCPLANIIDTNIRLVAEAISSHVEISRAERKNYIHARMLWPIHLFLHQQELVHWASLGFDELKKGLKSTRDFVAYGPHLTQIIAWCLANPGIHLGNRTRPEIPRSPPPPSPRIEELELNFEPTSADVNISDFIEENMQFADTEHSTADVGPSGTAHPADIEGSSQREVSEVIRRREVEERERKEREERERSEMREEQEAKAKTDEDVRMRSRTPSPQQGSNEDEEDWSFLEATITKIKREYRHVTRQGPSKAEYEKLKQKLEVEQANMRTLQLQYAQAEEKVVSLQERIGSLSIHLEQLKMLEACHEAA